MAQEFSRQALHDLVWSKAKTGVAKVLGISDVALGKICKKANIPVPPRGYWAARDAQKRPPRIAARPDPQAPVSYIPGTIALVSCVATKRAGKYAARDLYVSAWFKKVRQHVERAGLTWYVLSAKYGLVAPEQEIEAYKMTLNNMSVRDRRAWAYHVMGQIAEQLPGRDRFALFAGARYREFLEPLLAAQDSMIQVPMEGLTQGRQLNWLDTHQAHVQA